MSVADIVNTWFRERIATGAIARDTEAYNQATAALPDLIDRITAATISADAPAPAPAPTAAEAVQHETLSAAEGSATVDQIAAEPTGALHTADEHATA